MGVAALKLKPRLKMFYATMHVTRAEEWCVEAERGELRTASTMRMLPPYGLDPRFDDPLTRKRIGEVIARGMERQVSRRYRRSWRLRRFR